MNVIEQIKADMGAYISCLEAAISAKEALLPLLRWRMDYLRGEGVGFALEMARLGDEIASVSLDLQRLKTDLGSKRMVYATAYTEHVSRGGKNQ